MRNLIGLKETSAVEIDEILQEAFRLKKEVLFGDKKASYLSGKSIITLFYENSTRTRLSFELASKYLGATAANITASGSSVQKGESLADTIKTINAMAADVIIMRHPSSGAPYFAQKYADAAIVNAGDGMNEHPTQALLDMMTILETKGNIKGLRVAIVGDVNHSRVARSNIYGLKKLGADVVMGGPSTLMPADMEDFGVSVYNSVDKAVEGADVIMALRIQLERQKKGLFPTIREYHKYFGIDTRRLGLAAPDAIVMHPGPVNRGVELSAEVADGNRSAICNQVTNGVCVRMAVLKLLTEKQEVL